MPTGYTPIFKVMKGGEDITSRIDDRCTSLKVEHASGDGEGDKCLIIVDDRDWRVARPHVGDNLSIWMGYEEIGLSYMGSFQVNDVTFLGKPRSIQIMGLATGMRDIQKAPQIKGFKDKSVSDILGAIGKQTGLETSISPALGAFKFSFKNQITSNLHMIHEIERLLGAVGKIADGKLTFVPRGATQSVSGVEMPTLVLLPQHFGDWKVSYNSRSDYGGVKAAYWDDKDMVRKWVDNATGGMQGLPGFILGKVYKDQEEAQKATNSHMEAFNRAAVKATFDLAKGDPWIKDNQSLIVSGMRDGIDGSYVIEKAVHTYVKNTGIRSQLECRAPPKQEDFSQRAQDYFLRPTGNETIGDLLKNGVTPKWQVPQNITDLDSAPVSPN